MFAEYLNLSSLNGEQPFKGSNIGIDIDAGAAILRRSAIPREPVHVNLGIMLALGSGAVYTKL